MGSLADHQSAALAGNGSIADREIAFWAGGGIGGGGVTTTGSNVVAGIGVTITPAGADNMVYGLDAGAQLGAGAANRNCFYGRRSGRLVNTGTDNALYGHETGRSLTDSKENCFYGSLSGYSMALLANGYGHCFFGYQSGFYTTSGSFNAFFGHSSGYLNTVGGSNSFFGRAAGRANTSGSFGTYAGHAAGFSNTTGWGCIFIGDEAGYTDIPANANVTGDYACYVGFQAGPGTAVQLNKASAFGYKAKATADNVLILGGTGADQPNVGIGITNPSYIFQVVGSVGLSGNFGVHGVVPSAQAAAIASPTSDAVGTKAAIDSIRAVLSGKGLTA